MAANPDSPTAKDMAQRADRALQAVILSLAGSAVTEAIPTGAGGGQGTMLASFDVPPHGRVRIMYTPADGAMVTIRLFRSDNGAGSS